MCKLYQRRVHVKSPGYQPVEQDIGPVLERHTGSDLQSDTEVLNGAYGHHQAPGKDRNPEEGVHLKQVQLVDHAHTRNVVQGVGCNGKVTRKRSRHWSGVGCNP